MRTLAYCELEGFAQANLISKMEKGLMDVAPLWNDLKTFPYESFHGLVDILIAGYPCQPFSAAGKRAGKEDPRHLWPWIADGIRLLRPRMCFFENVEGHISLGLREVVGELEQMGYEVSWGIFSAREVGAPHQRKRVFILAVSNSIGGAAGVSRSLAWNEGIAGEFDHGSGEAWPSRPGESQHGWEPPRVVGTVPAKLANFCTWDAQQGGDPAQTSCEGVSAWGEGADAMPNRGSSVCGGDQGNEQAGVLANSILVGRGRGDHGDAGGLRGEIQVEGSCCSGREAMGNAESKQGTPRDHRGESGSLSQQEQVESGGGDCGALRENNGQAEPSLGGDIDGSSDRLDYAELQVSCDNRTDELRLLGNGVVPATAERAFRTLLEELITK